MRNEKRHLLIQTNVPLIALSIVLCIAFISLSCLMGASQAFADDDGAAIQEADTGSSIVVSIACGEHGKVNGKTGDITETVTSGADLKLILSADEGYLIGSVLINDEPLAASDLIGIDGETNSQLDLEGLEDALSVKVIFVTAADYEKQIPIPGATDPSAGGAGSGNDSWQSDAGTSADGTGESDPTMQDGGNGIITDPDKADGFGGGSDDGVDSTENTFDNTEDEDGFEPDDEWGAEDDAEDLAMLASEESDGTSEGDDHAAADSDAIGADSLVSSDGIVKSVGTAASTTLSDNTSDTDDDDDYEDGSDSKGEYDEDYDDDYDTPKTGDESIFPAASVLLIGIMLLCIACVIAVRGEDLRTGGDQE